MNKTFYLISSIAILFSGIALYRSMQQPKIAYIRSSELIYSYEGMKESQRLFQSKKISNQANLDTLKMELQHAVNLYSKDLSKLKDKDKKERQELLQRQQQSYIEYNETIKENEKKQETQMTEGVLNQVNSFIEEYSKDHGYDVVLGTTNSGNLLYAKEAMDITKEVLDALNANYKSQPSEGK